MVPFLPVLVLKLLGALAVIFVLILNDPESLIRSLGSSLYLTLNFCYILINYVSRITSRSLARSI